MAREFVTRSRGLTRSRYRGYSKKDPNRWMKLCDIAIGIARGLEYLHLGCWVHFDIKPHNILLDEDLCPKTSDFGLTKSCRPKESMLSLTEGYIAPEVLSQNFGVVTSKSDVYSFGMLVLEMVGARRNNVETQADTESEQYFPNWIYQHLFDEDAIIKLCGVTK
ncbi:hypothetical protein Taro_040028 [Colocasia esculenta]|uniref:Protein kinase domain-containing protein n=1 Tax=Colocasia esculenta TaxID=4460 RepID=A0A843WKK9_COLES|nr:hypothetical protein [Colocasia esculenta]